MTLELKKLFSILKIKLSVLNKEKTYVLVLRFFEEYILNNIIYNSNTEFEDVFKNNRLKLLSVIV